MSWTPSYILYNSTGTGQIYTFTYVQGDNSPQDPSSFVELNSFRGQGSVIIPGGDPESWDLQLDFILKGADYEAVIALMDALETTIVKNTPYVLKIDRTSSTTKNYKVKRLLPFIFEEGRRTSIQRVTVILRVNSWN